MSWSALVAGVGTHWELKYLQQWMGVDVEVVDRLGELKLVLRSSGATRTLELCCDDDHWERIAWKDSPSTERDSWAEFVKAGKALYGRATETEMGVDVSVSSRWQ